MPSSRNLVGASGMYLETNCPTPTRISVAIQRGNAVNCGHGFHEAGLYATIDFHWGGEQGYIRRLYVVIHACLMYLFITLAIVIIIVIVIIVILFILIMIIVYNGTFTSHTINPITN